MVVMIVTMLVGVVSPGSAKSEDLEIKFTTIITHEFQNNLLTIRPIDYKFSSKIYRVELMLGRRFRKKSIAFSAHGYWKRDSKERSWLGTQLDFNFLTFEDRLSTTLTLRLFGGLNQKSQPHWYFIPSVKYKMDDKGFITIGMSGYGKKTRGRDPFFYVGPTLTIKLNDYLSPLLGYGRNILGSGNLLWLKLRFYF
jgi:hypothetical protein